MGLPLLSDGRPARKIGSAGGWPRPVRGAARSTTNPEERTVNKWMAGAAIFGAVLGGTSLVSASIPNDGGTVTACISRGGAVRVIDAAVTACKTDPASQAEQTIVLSGPVQLPPPPPPVAVVNGAPSEEVVVGPQGVVRLASRCPGDAVAVG